MVLSVKLLYYFVVINLCYHFIRNCFKWLIRSYMYWTDSFWFDTGFLRGLCWIWGQLCEFSIAYISSTKYCIRSLSSCISCTGTQQYFLFIYIYSDLDKQNINNCKICLMLILLSEFQPAVPQQNYAQPVAAAAPAQQPSAVPQAYYGSYYWADLTKWDGHCFRFL